MSCDPQAPSLDAIAADPASASTLSADQRQAVLLRAAAVMAALAASNPREARPKIEAPAAGNLLTPREAAQQFNVSKRWLLAHADTIPGVRRLSKKMIRFNEPALRHHLNGKRS